MLLSLGRNSVEMLRDSTIGCLLRVQFLESKFLEDPYQLHYGAHRHALFPSSTANYH